MTYYDPHVVEQMEIQKPTCIPLSYALRFLTDAARKECAKSANTKRRLSQVNILASATRNRNNAATPTGSDAEEGDEFASEPDDSNDSSTTSEEFSADFILRYGSRVINQSVSNPPSNIVNSNGSTNTNNNSSDKPFACPVPGCKKRYKNVNGIKYHSKNGHKKDGKIRKAFRCPCGKSYKTPSGLKNHTVIQHAGSVLQNGKIASIKYDHQTSNHHHHQQQQQRDSLSKACGGGIPLEIGKNSFAKAKVAAIEDHGYMKSEKSMYTETETSSMNNDCEEEDLGILTPASTPPLLAQSPAKSEISQQQSQQRNDRTLQKYLASVVASTNTAQQRRNILDNGNAY
ncbi:uncharacterized protein [Venturia canescens]|uniref:uncharacterized protein isoform X2 n=1 Tax=Venturia canescens TaxID=32260 RepID=UPI001C9D53A2|nr:uncharacterized protein LOC122410718 isoform X2 [Venturia canescens]